MIKLGKHDTVEIGGSRFDCEPYERAGCRIPLSHPDYALSIVWDSGSYSDNRDRSGFDRNRSSSTAEIAIFHKDKGLVNLVQYGETFFDQVIGYVPAHTLELAVDALLTIPEEAHPDYDWVAFGKRLQLMIEGDPVS